MRDDQQKAFLAGVEMARDAILRDTFAGYALSGMLANPKVAEQCLTVGELADKAFRFADEMIRARG